MTTRSEIPKGNETILLVDDEIIVRQLVSKLLQRLGYRVYVASDGEMAANIYLEMDGEISLVLLDLSMHDMNGGKCLKNLLTIDPNVRVLGSSEHVIQLKSDKILSTQVKGIIQKPYRIRELAKMIRAALKE